MTALHVGASYNKASTTVQLLLQAGADQDATDEVSLVGNALQ